MKSQYLPGLIALLLWCCVLPQAGALPSFARQTGQKCAACHVGGNWPQLTPWGRFFKLSGYTAGKAFVNKEGGDHVPLGVFGQGGLTWAARPNDANGQSVISNNASPELYQVTGEAATKLTNFLGVFYEYQVGNTFPGWKGTSGAVDLRAVHFFHLDGTEILVGIDSNNSPTVQDVWNTAPDWTFPFYSSPQAPAGPASPIIGNLGGQAGSIGAYALVGRQVYVEASFYRAATGFLRWMSAGTSFAAGGKNYLEGYNPYWRAYWDKVHGPHSYMIGAFGMRASVYPDSSIPSGPADLFTDYGFDSQYQYLGGTHKFTLQGSYIYERRAWDASFPLGDAGTPKGNLKPLNLNGSYAYRNAWAFRAGYFLTNGNSDSALYAITTPSGTQVTASPKTAGYTFEVDRHVTQNIQLTAQYRGFARFNGLRNNIDGIGRKASDNNTLWLSVFCAF
ncbi:MAG: hypothetical protein M3Y57_21745 [Acidobacteriota bacterium]|nr:hypothetical protein [Acidobacteriota bacterium]